MDTYTKGVLTVIAIALVSISFQLSQTEVIDKAHAMNGCGDMFNPCVITAGIDPATAMNKSLAVYIVNK